MSCYNTLQWSAKNKIMTDKLNMQQTALCSIVLTANKRGKLHFQSLACNDPSSIPHQKSIKPTLPKTTATSTTPSSYSDQLLIFFHLRTMVSKAQLAAV